MFFGGDFFGSGFYSSEPVTDGNFFHGLFFDGGFFQALPTPSTYTSGYVPSKKKKDLITPMLYQQDREVVEFITTFVTQYM